MKASTVLSYTQKIVLSTLYMSGIRRISLKLGEICLFSGNTLFPADINFAGTFRGSLIDDTLDFSVMRDYIEENKLYDLGKIIKRFCPEYSHIVDNQKSRPL